MKIRYDRTYDRLAYFGKKADCHFWDTLWESKNVKKDILSGKNELFVYPITKRYLPPKKEVRILEGGCGKGSYVYSLQYRGYEAYGIDYASETIKKIKEVFPELNVETGDVRKLQYPDNFFDGYWSLGVIEHFWEGYNEIVDEMYRVLKTGGFLFLTFPQISPFRRYLIKKGHYQNLSENPDLESFYQFALNPNIVVETFKDKGFQLVESKSYDGLKTILDETKSPYLRKMLYNFYNTNNFVLKIAKLIITQILAHFSGHIRLLVLKKEK